MAWAYSSFFRQVQTCFEGLLCPLAAKLFISHGQSKVLLCVWLRQGIVLWQKMTLDFHATYPALTALLLAWNHSGAIKKRSKIFSQTDFAPNWIEICKHEILNGSFWANCFLFWYMYILILNGHLWPCVPMCGHMWPFVPLCGHMWPCVALSSIALCGLFVCSIVAVLSVIWSCYQWFWQTGQNSYEWLQYRSK